jgi:hypothetical protein
MNLHRVWLLFIAFSLSAVLSTRAGHPEPAQRKSQGERDANMALLQFQNALAADRWGDALALCSVDVQNQAKAWPSAEKFFKDTMPIEPVLARDFSRWSCGDTFCGMFETISAYDEQPRIDWYWGIALAGNGKWVVDYPPVPMAEYVVQRKALLKARDEKIAAVQHSLESKVPFIRTRLIPLTNRFVTGQPMRFRVELTNAGPTDVYYMEGGLNHYGLVVRDERGPGTVLTNTASPAQIGVQTQKLPAHSAVVLAEVLDITTNHRVVEPGKYAVQFDGSTLQIGERVPMEPDTDRFGRTLGIGWGDFFGATNKFPSNAVKIDVRR